ncbi:MAG: leucine-rich repeat protein [Clostridia bacterium]|nr:leucine-rich repeat protein [Clostridia bacterium]
MKKVLLLLALCVVLVAVFASCSCGGSETATKPATTSGQTPTTTQNQGPTSDASDSTTSTTPPTPTVDEFGNSSADLVEDGYVENGLTYTIYKNAAKLIAADETATEIAVPAKIKDGTVAVKFVASHAFKNNETVTKITLADGIEVLGKEVFYGCFNLKEVTLSNAITAIGDGLFRNCYALEKAVLPNTITSMGTDVFFECRSLKVVALPDNDSFVIVPNETFYNCTSLEEVTLPASTTVIGEKAFYYCTALKGITFTDKITAIGVKAFYNCTSLATVDLTASGVTSIPNYAFYKCSSLTSLKMSDNTKAIGAYAFYGCESLDAITIPDLVSSISTGAFAYCTKIKTIKIPNDIKTLSDRIFYQCQALETIEMANDITSIGESALANTALKSFTVPATVTELKKGAFSYCAALESITFADGFAMGDFAANLFAYCTALKSIVIPASVTVINNGALSYCTALEDVTLSPETIQISQNSFLNSAAIKEITIPDTVTSIGRNSIGISLVDGVATPNKNTKIYAFEGGNVGNFLNSAGLAYTSLGVSGHVPFSDIEVKPITGKNGQYELVKYLGTSTEIAISDIYKDGKITKIAENFMKDNATVVSVKLPDTITEIGASAFENCTALTSVNIPTGVTAIADKTFKNTAITTISPSTAVKSLTSIGASAFEGCSALASTNISSTSKLTEIGDRAFAGTAITTFTVSNTVTKLGNEVFADCALLLYVEMLGNAPTIGTGVLDRTSPLAAFHYATGNTTYTVDADGYWNGYKATTDSVKNGTFKTFELTVPSADDPTQTVKVGTAKLLYTGELNISGETTKAHLPDFESETAMPWQEYKKYISKVSISKVERIGNYTFAGLDRIQSIQLPSTGLLEIGDYAFKDMTALNVLSIPSTVTKLGKGAFVGTALTTISLSKVTVIPEELFMNVTTLTELNITSKVTEIGARAFMNTSITKFSMNEATAVIGDEAFKGCTQLEAITTSAAKFGAGAFEGCTALNALAIGNKVEEIGDRAFKGIAIEKITLPNTLTTIGNEAFADCANLNEITLSGKAPTIGTDVLKNTPIYAHFFYTGTDTSYTLDADGKWNGYAATSDTSKIMASFDVDDGKVTVSITYKGILSVTVNEAGGVIPNYESAEAVPWNAYKDYVTTVQLSTVAAVGDYAFAGFTKISDLKLTAKTTAIGKQAFAGCTSLSGVTSYATSIGEEAFAGCTKLATANLNKVTDFGYRAFADCLSLQNVTITGSLGPVSASAANAFENTPYGAL